MNFINKSVHRDAGNLIVDNFLENAWNETENLYLGADYSGLSNAQYKGPLINLMLEEADSKCCYCMKEVVSQETTIEHIIPQAIPEESFNSYLVVDELTEHVTHKDTFIRNLRIIPPEKYPHDIAYSNLVSSCNSNKHCNNFRKNKDIEPFLFDERIAQKVTYDVAGLIDCDEYMQSFENLGLISDSLNRIRRIWKKLSLEIEEPVQLTEERIDLELYSLIEDPEYITIIETFTPTEQSSLKHYQWFYNYYRNK
jgi:hypothetical protein